MVAGFHHAAEPSRHMGGGSDGAGERPDRMLELSAGLGEASVGLVEASDRTVEPFNRMVERFNRAVEPFHRAEKTLKNRKFTSTTPKTQKKDPAFMARTEPEVLKKAQEQTEKTPPLR
jgi:hypothetical protein